jgi:hypothetical protein
MANQKPTWPHPMAKFILGALIAILIAIIASKILDHFQVYKWFR